MGEVGRRETGKGGDCGRGREGKRGEERGRARRRSEGREAVVMGEEGRGR